MIVDVMDAIDVLVTAIAVWIVVGVACATPVLLLAGWAVRWFLRAVWRLAVRWARRGSCAGTGAPHSPPRDPVGIDTPPEPSRAPYSRSAMKEAA